MTIKNLFISYLQRRGLRKKSEQTYTTKINIFCDYLSKARVYRLNRVTKAVAEAFLDTVSKSPTTRNAYRDTMRSFFKDAMTAGLIKTNPFGDIKKRAEARQGKKYFTDEQVIQLSAVIEEENPILWMACKTLYYCFIRNTEMSKLPLEDVYHNEGVIRVFGGYSKNKKTQPVIVPDEFISDIQEWFIKQKAQGVDLFFTYKGKSLARGDWFSKQHAKILRRLGYSHRYSFYSWKHTGAVHFYRQTKDLKALQLQLRHHSLDQVDEYLRELGVIENIGIKVHTMPKKNAMQLAA